MTTADFTRLVAAAEANAVKGWDWSALTGRYLETEPPWDYRARVQALLPGTHTLLDMGTGGGEFLSSLHPLPPETWATEGYPPNIPVAKARLDPLGVRVVAVDDDAYLPLPDAHFNLIINRHASFSPAEIRRILRPGGQFLTQQVGGRDNAELNKALQGTKRLDNSDWNLLDAAAQLRAVGLEVLDEREVYSPARFTDIGAVVMYLRFVPWQLENFDVSTFHDRLLALHHLMQVSDGLETSVHRFLIVARLPE